MSLYKEQMPGHRFRREDPELLSDLPEETPADTSAEGPKESSKRVGEMEFVGTKRLKHGEKAQSDNDDVPGGSDGNEVEGGALGAGGEVKEDGGKDGGGGSGENDDGKSEGDKSDGSAGGQGNDDDSSDSGHGHGSEIGEDLKIHLDNIVAYTQFVDERPAFPWMVQQTNRCATLIHGKADLAFRVRNYLTSKGVSVLFRNARKISPGELKETVDTGKGMEPCVLVIRKVEEAADDVVTAFVEQLRAVCQPQRSMIFVCCTANLVGVKQGWRRFCTVVRLKELEA